MGGRLFFRLGSRMTWMTRPRLGQVMISKHPDTAEAVPWAQSMVQSLPCLHGLGFLSPAAFGVSAGHGQIMKKPSIHAIYRQ